MDVDVDVTDTSKMTDDERRAYFTGHFIGKKCPKCGATLLGNKHGDEWCSFVGDGARGIPGCDFRDLKEGICI